MTAFWNRDGGCSLRGTNWILKYEYLLGFPSVSFQQCCTHIVLTRKIKGNIWETSKNKNCIREEFSLRITGFNSASTGCGEANIALDQTCVNKNIRKPSVVFQKCMHALVIRGQLKIVIAENKSMFFVEWTARDAWRCPVAVNTFSPMLHASLISKFIYRKYKCSHTLANPATLTDVSHLSVLFKHSK